MPPFPPVTSLHSSEGQLRYLIIICALLALIFIQPPAYAQNIEDYVSTGGPATWVEEQEIPSPDEPGGDARYLLVDSQVRVSRTTADGYYRYVEALTTPQLVEDGSTVTITLDPAFETVQLHHIRLIRDGTTDEILDLSKFDFFRHETDRDRLIYNGQMQLSFLVPGVRPGDILDYAYTLSGQNPAIGSNFKVNFPHQYAIEVGRLHNRFLVEEKIEVFQKAYADAMAPKITTIGGYDEYTWVFEPAVKKIVDDNIPPWYSPLPSTSFSSFKNWSEVGQFFASYYQPPATPSNPIAAIAEEIRATTDQPSAQLRAALSFVQREIRYLGIELGPGGYIPRDPDLVLSRRFGDCKDMTLLLITILDALEIKATPLLVSLGMTGGIEGFIPSHAAFDHVIVAATLDGKNYNLDPTRGEQLGDLDHLQQGDFGKGVIVAANSPGMVDVVAPKPDYFKSIIDTFDLKLEPTDVEMTSVSTYYMSYADGMWGWFENAGKDSIEKSFLDYYLSIYPTIEQTDTLQFDIFPDKGKVTVTAKYKILDAWKTDSKTKIKNFTTYARDIYNDIPTFVGARRTTPFALDSPVRTRQTLRFQLSGDWDLPAKEMPYSRPAFDYNEMSKYQNGIYTNVFTYKTKSDRIETKDFRKSMADIDTINDGMVVGLQLSSE